MSYSYRISETGDNTALLTIEQDTTEVVNYTVSLSTDSTSVEFSIPDNLLGAAVSGSGIADSVTITSISESSFVLSDYPIKDIKKANINIERRLPATPVASVRIDLSEIRDRTNVRATVIAGESHATTFLVI